MITILTFKSIAGKTGSIIKSALFGKKFQPFPSYWALVPIKIGQTKVKDQPDQIKNNNY